jgi:peroxiredoxin Q/BCP
MVRVGEETPEFDVVASDGRRYSSRDLRGRKNLVLYFYPKDFTLVCTAESCGFRDMYDEVQRSDTEILGVSLDSDESHRRFAQTYELRFGLVSDRDQSLTRRFGAISTARGLLGLAKRLTFVIDKRSIVAGVFEGDLSPRPHLQGVASLLARLAGSAPVATQNA